MALITYGSKRFEAPSASDPANLALHLQRLAEQFEPELLSLEWWSDFLSSGTSFNEVGTPAIYRNNTVTQTGYVPSVEKSVLWNNTFYDNTFTASGTNDFILPDQDQRYWWWMGVNLLLPAITLDARMTARLYVQDRDPATGQVLTGVYRYNQYMKTEGDQYMLFDGLFRTGGGRQRVTYAHGNSGNSSVLSSSSMWAVRICPDR